MWWNPKELSPHVTNLELWILFGFGFLLGRPRAHSGTIAALVLMVVGPLLIVWWRGYCGLDQWPNPHGRYYREWMRLKDVGDYYDWLARRMGNREPWTDWARMDRGLGD